jgi:hypothetical protein
MDQPFLSQFRDILVIESVSNADHCPVKTVISGLVAANEQNRCAPRIEGVERA